VYKWTKAKTTENPEYNNHSCGVLVNPVDRKKSLTSPFLPNNGIHEIILITFEVQNGIVQRRNKAICHVSELT
jgi:hypothetical protein